MKPDPAKRVRAAACALVAAAGGEVQTVAWGVARNWRRAGFHGWAARGPIAGYAGSVAGAGAARPRIMSEPFSAITMVDE